MSDGGYARGSSSGITGGKVVGTLAWGVDASKVSVAAMRYSDIRSELIYICGRVSGV